jgi:hypothetical protein
MQENVSNRDLSNSDGDYTRTSRDDGRASGTGDLHRPSCPLGRA